MKLIESEEVDTTDVNKGEDDQEPIQVQGNDGMDEEVIDEELNEEGEEATAGTTGGGPSQGYPSLNLWGTNAVRSKGNPIGITKWKSGRTFGPTGNNYKDA